MSDSNEKKGCFATIITAFMGGVLTIKGATCEPLVSSLRGLRGPAVEEVARLGPRGHTVDVFSHVHPRPVELPGVKPPERIGLRPVPEEPAAPGRVLPGSHLPGEPPRPPAAPYPHGMDRPPPFLILGAPLATEGHEAKDLAKLPDLIQKGDWASLNREVARLHLPNASPEARASFDALHAEAKYLCELEVLQAALTPRPGTDTPELATIKAALESLQGRTKDTPLARRIQNALIERAMAERHPDLAQKIRDVKLIESTHESASPGPAASAGSKLPVPEPGRDSVRPGPKGSVAEELPHLEKEGTRSGESSNETVREALSQQTSQASNHAAILARQLLHLHDLPPRPKEDDADTRYEAEVKAALGRELTPSERILTREMHRQGKAPTASAEVFRDLSTRELPR